MPDADVFDARFSRAYRRYLDEAPTGGDPLLVVRAVVAADRARGVGTGAGARLGHLAGLRPLVTLRTSPALALVVILGLLLLVGLALAAGSHRSSVLTGCGPGAGTPASPPVDEPRPPAAGNVAAATFVRSAHVILLVVPNSTSSELETWAFDVCTNRWTERRPSVEPMAAGLGAAALQYDAATDLSIYLDLVERQVWAYAYGPNAWTPIAGIPAAFTGPVAFASDSTRGRVIVWSDAGTTPGSGSQLWAFEPRTSRWTRLAEAGSAPSSGPGVPALMTYDNAADVLVLGRPGESSANRFQVWRYDMRRETWSANATYDGPYIFLGEGSSGGEMTFDDELGCTVVIAHGTVAAFDARTNRWATLSLGPGTADPVTRLNQTTIYDPVNHRYVVYGGSRFFGGAIGWAQDDEVIAFDPAIRQWLELLNGTSVTPMW